jgi:hypothetical protein
LPYSIEFNVFGEISSFAQEEETPGLFALIGAICLD